jgi:hypothetical protein
VQLGARHSAPRELEGANSLTLRLVARVYPMQIRLKNRSD